jgi:hypothetical protein
VILIFSRLLGILFDIFNGYNQPLLANSGHDNPVSIVTRLLDEQQGI